MKTIVQISDTHLMDMPNKNFVDMNPEISFYTLMDTVRQRHPKIDSIIHTGDVAQVAIPQTYQRYLNYMQGLQIPFYQTPGNHDDITIFPFPQNKPMSVIDLGTWCIILLNSAVAEKTDGHINAEELHLLDKTLAEKKQQHVIIGCHHHPLHVHSEWIDQHCLKNTADFANVIQKYTHIKAIIHGHIHQEAEEHLGNIRILSVPSTCIQFKPKSKNFALDSNAPGYRLLQLHDDGRLESQIYRVSHAKEQINLNISGY